MPDRLLVLLCHKNTFPLSSRGHTMSRVEAEAALEIEPDTWSLSMSPHVAQAALAAPRGLKRRGRRAARRKERGSGGESRARSAARNA